MDSGEDIRVLVVDNEPDIIETFSYWLRDKYDVVDAMSGQEALDKVSDDIDIVLLDRRMPGMAGEEILEFIRDNGIKCRVAMVTAVTPDFDILEMGFDDYLVKPVRAEDLLSVVDNLVRRDEYGKHSRDLFSNISKKVVLEREKDKEDLIRNDEYNELLEQIDSLEEKTTQFMDEMTSEDFKAVMRDITNGS